MTAEKVGLRGTDVKGERRKVHGEVFVGFLWGGTCVIPGEVGADSRVLQHWAAACSFVLSLGQSALALSAHGDGKPQALCLLGR